MASQDNTSGPISAPQKDEVPPSSDIHKPSPAAAGSPAVRFASENEEIEPLKSLDESVKNARGDNEADIRELTQTLHGAHLQNRRMSAFNFEPMSLPASRVPSHDDSSREPSRHPTHTSSSKPSPRLSSANIPIDAIPISSNSSADNTASRPDSRPASPGASTRPTTLSAESSEGVERDHRHAFSIGPGTGESASASRDPSPSRSTYSRPFTPVGDANDPYAASKRPPQSKNLDTIEPRFKFSGLRPKASPTTSSATLPRSSRSSTDMSKDKDKDKKHSVFGPGKKDSFGHVHEDSSSSIHSKGSMSELKRFLKIGGHHKAKRAASPTPSQHSGSKTPPHHKTPQQLPFGDDHGLTSRYGKFGKVLGAGAGGSVRLMKRSTDGTTFAVKEFRPRHSYETEKEYAKKVTAEFCVGSTLHHGNIIETLDIVQEKGKWYEVMEYAPYDLFAIVMTGKMSREEVTCSFLQILAGVTYIHSMGLAHRDLKLDNVVVNEFGIMKIIDFGSASMFRYPFENEIVLATGIVGSDPYLAPEVYDERKYDPRPADIWSLAIIFCCMSLRRFPWKLPRLTDNSYKLFACAPNQDQQGVRKLPENAAKSTGDINNARERDTEPVQADKAEKADKDGKEEEHDGPEIEKAISPAVSLKTGPVIEPTPEVKKPEVIKGPWRLLRLLPRESRHIMSRMLQIDPRKRATMEEILDDDWIKNTLVCRQDADNRIYRAPGHTHTLEPPAANPS